MGQRIVAAPENRRAIGCGRDIYSADEGALRAVVARWVEGGAHFALPEAIIDKAPKT